MKKVIFSLIVLCACSIVSCMKSNDTDGNDYKNRVVLERTDTKESVYCLFAQSGHRRSECGGKCITIAGYPTHADCQGYGQYCSLATSVTLQQVGSIFTATTIDTFGLTSENFFAMPARSLYYYTEDNNNIVYLNIPAQMVYRDTATLQFTFTGLFLTNVPEYSND